MPRYIVQPTHKGNLRGEFPGATDIEAIDDTGLFYINLSETEAKAAAGHFLRQLDDNIHYEKRKITINASHVKILFLICLGLFIVEQVGILPSVLLLSGQITYISIAAFTFIIVLLASQHCIQKIVEKENAGLYLLTLSVIWISFLFSLAVVIYPSVFLSIGILPLFSLPLSTISALSIAHYYNAIVADQMLKKWCNMANTKIAQLAFQVFKSHQRKTTIKFEAIEENDILEIKPSMHIPVDGRIVLDPEAKTEDDENDSKKTWKIDESIITGESIAQNRTIGSELKGGSKNTSSESLYLKTTQSGEAVLDKRIANFNRYNSEEIFYEPVLGFPKKEEKLRKAKIYFEFKDNALQYKVLNSSKKEKIATITEAELKTVELNFATLLSNDQLVLQKLKKYLPKILVLTSKNGHTQINIPKINSGNDVAFLFTALLLLGVTATVLLWFFMGPAPVLSYILLQSLAVLNCFSPVAVAIAQMLPLYLSRGSLFENNILIIDDALKDMQNITIAIFDKTGTLTGNPSVLRCRFIESSDLKPDEILKLVASAQNLYKGKNTYARAVCAHADQNHHYKAEQDKEAVGMVRGASAYVESKGSHPKKRVLCGSLDYITHFYPDLHIDVTDDPKDKTVSFVVIDGTYRGWVSFESSIRPDAKATIAALQAHHIKVMMLTGDSNKNVAKNIAIQAGILDEKEKNTAETEKEDKEKRIRETVHYGNQEKAKFIRELKAAYPEARILMVGDGVNDGDALQAAHVGLSISDLADAVQFAVGNLRGQLIEIETLIKISIKMNSHIRSNVWSLLITTLLSMLVAAGITYPMLGFLLAPTLASIVGSVISLFSAAVILYNFYDLYTYLGSIFASELVNTPTSSFSALHSPIPQLQPIPPVRLASRSAGYSQVPRPAQAPVIPPGTMAVRSAKSGSKVGQ